MSERKYDPGEEGFLYASEFLADLASLPVPLQMSAAVLLMALLINKHFPDNYQAVRERTCALLHRAPPPRGDKDEQAQGTPDTRSRH